MAPDKPNTGTFALWDGEIDPSWQFYQQILKWKNKIVNFESEFYNIINMATWQL